MTTSSENFFVFQTLFQEYKLSLKYDFQKINHNPVSKFNHRGHFFFFFLNLKYTEYVYIPIGFPWWFSDKESICQCRRYRFYPWVRKVPWGRKWQPTLVFLPGKSHGQRNLVDYSQWGHKRVRYNLATKQQHFNWDLHHLWVFAYLLTASL